MNTPYTANIARLEAMAKAGQANADERYGLTLDRTRQEGYLQAVEDFTALQASHAKLVNALRRIAAGELGPNAGEVGPDLSQAYHALGIALDALEAATEVER